MSTGLELLTTDEMALADRLAPTLGAPSLGLMENAGRAVAEEAMKIAPPGSRIAVLCGPGNNGGDGFVAARLLMEHGFLVRLALVGDRAGLEGDAAVMADRYQGTVFGPGSIADLCAKWADLVIDALFGAGLARPLEGAAAAAVVAMNASPGTVVAVDVPSGLDGTTGATLGPVVEADRTITFFRRKPGHLLLPGRMLCGPVTVAQIGMPAAVLDSVRPAVAANGPALWRDALPRLRLDGHKYTRGHAVVVSGGIEMSGAARLCARGALRIGAGLVTVASPPDALLAHAAQLNATLLKGGTTPDEIRDLLADSRYNAIAIGPGLGRGEGALAQVMAALGSGAAVVLDADAITVAAGSPADVFGAVAGAKRPVVLTPHEGEFKRLFPDAAGSKLDRARAAAQLSGAVVILKGPDTVVAAADGRAVINENAPPTLATAGSGDVLAGFVTGLLAQGMPAFEAACAAVWLHGECANAFGPGLIAEDVPETLPCVLSVLGQDQGRGPRHPPGC
ncbi:MAG: NAD(P)H-hydrate dehydratase [Hyphomicrobiaceae bacterium]|nr:NAD(P)H-hydrate dehydratase [Hyphomicrobiaceae bacterium]